MLKMGLQFASVIFYVHIKIMQILCQVCKMRKNEVKNIRKRKEKQNEE